MLLAHAARQSFVISIASYHKKANRESVFPPGRALFFVSFGLFFSFFQNFFQQLIFQMSKKTREKPGKMEIPVANDAVYAGQFDI